MTVRDSFLYTDSAYHHEWPCTTEFVFEWGSPHPIPYLVPIAPKSPGDNVVAIHCDHCDGTHYYERKPGRVSCYGCGAALSCI